MRLASGKLVLFILVTGCISVRAAEPPPSFTKDIRPFLTDYCRACHTKRAVQGGLLLDTYDQLLRGGKNGPALVPGKPDESLLLQMIEGKAKPVMPPARSLQPTKDEIKLVRHWIAAGAAKDGISAARQASPPKQPTPPVTALAYRPDGKLLAAAGAKEVLLLDVASGDVLAKLPGQSAKITGLAFCRDGQRLAVASGSPGKNGEVRVYLIPETLSTPPAPSLTINAHKDLIHDLGFSPDGKLLATCSYDRLIKLLDTVTGNELRTLKDHSDAVYGIAFSPDGQLLASAAADRAVKVWDTATGTRLYTLGEATDWLYTVAWSPDGKHLAAAGVDRSIRVWEVSAAEGRLIQSAFAHEAPVIRLTYAKDDKTLYSLSEDHSVKAWDAGRLNEKRVYPKQPETILALALRPDQKQLALGRFDGVAVLLEEATGKVQSEPLPVKPKPPVLTKVTPSAGQRGTTVRVKLEGKHLDGLEAVAINLPDVKTRIVTEPSGPEAEVTFPPTTPAGVYQLTVKSAVGESNKLPFIVDLYAAVAEQERHDSPRTGQAVRAPVTIAGSLDRGGDVDFYRFELAEGQELGVQAIPGTGSKLEAVLTLADDAGNTMTESNEGLLGFRAPKKGIYALGIRDRDYRGEAGMSYRLHLGDIPIITSVFPLGLQRGSEQRISVYGVHLGEPRPISVRAAPDAALGAKLPIQLSTPQGPALGNRSVVVGEFPEHGLLPREFRVRGSKKTDYCGDLPVPGTANGRVFSGLSGVQDVWTFQAKRGQPLVIEVEARRLGSALDSVIEIRNGLGEPLQRAVLRSVAKTHVAFRDHDSATANIRLVSWSELAINDYVYAGNELLRIKAMPTHPDADAAFFSAGGQRTGYLATTPTALPMGAPMYKVELHPPGTTFPPNGYPVFTIPYRNDDGGPGYGKDSLLFFDPPADGWYQVRVSDASGTDGAPYRLTIRPPRPSFNLSLNPTAPAVWKGGALPINVTADRIDGYEGAIELRLENLPPGFCAPVTSIPAGENWTSFALFAETNASVPADAQPLKLKGSATIGSQTVVKEFVGQKPKLQDPGDIVTATEQSDVTLPAGGEVRLTVRIERKNGFKGRVPVEVKGLPHGVKVKDIGLNGILITEKETVRTMVLYAEPWVQPQEHPIVVLAKHEGKNTEHAARSVLLRIGKR